MKAEASIKSSNTVPLPIFMSPWKVLEINNIWHVLAKALRSSQILVAGTLVKNSRLATALATMPTNYAGSVYTVWGMEEGLSLA